jgi:MFS family permease
MSCQTVTFDAAPGVSQAEAHSHGRAGWKLSATPSFFLLASLTVGFLGGASAPTALYPTYQAHWGLSSLDITLVFGSYAIAVLTSLLVLGRLSDHVGRKPVLLAATLLQAGTMWLFATADGFSDLLFARVLQGLALGGAIAAIGAGMLDVNRNRGALANAVTPPAGTALGGIVGGLLVGFLPAPTHLVFVAFGALFLLQGLGVLLIPETAPPRAGALASLRPQFAVSKRTRGPLLRAVPPIVAAWALAGFFGALGPALVKQILGVDSALLSGLTMFVLAGAAVAAVLVLRNRSAERMVSYGAAALLAGIVIVVTAVAQHWPTLFFVGLALSGVGFGIGFQGAVRSVVTVAAPQERAGVVSIVFLLAYLAMGLPAIVAGYLIVHGSDLASVTREFALLVVLLGAVSLLRRGKLADYAPGVRT